MKIKIVENFIDKADADVLISEINKPSSFNPYPEYYANRNGGTAFPYNDAVMDILKKYSIQANKIQEDFFQTNKKVIVTKSFGSCWVAGKSGSPHIDAIELEPFIEYSSVIYLNDEYEGGEIYFPNQNFSIKPKKYSAIFFPGNDMEYLHGVSEIISGNRYTALYMQSTKLEFEDPDFGGLS
jgi:hypothetical protein